MSSYWIRVARTGLWTAVLLLASASASSASDKNHAAVSGVACDESGCVVTNVKIWVTNVTTGHRRESVTDKKGHFAVLDLDPGTYSLRAESPGFAVVEISGVVLTAEHNRGLCLKLRGSTKTPPSGDQSCGLALCSADSRSE